jgi:hypothetical protein
MSLEVYDVKYTCAVDADMESTAVDSGKEVGVRSPPPFTYRPGSGYGYYSGYWDTSLSTEISDTPYSSTEGLTDAEGG